MKNLFRFFALACCLNICQGARAAVDPVRMLVESPFAQTVKPLSLRVKFARWFPVAVTMTNKGDAVNGRLTLRLSDSSSDNNTRALISYTDIDLPTNARKRIWLYGRSDNDSWDGATVTFAARGRKTLASEFTIEQSEPGQRAIVTIGDAGESLKFLSGFNDKRLGAGSEMNSGFVPPGSRNSLLRPLGATHELVPDRWFGLEAADIVVLHDFAHTSLSPEQIAALRGFVAGGGTLAIPAGQNWQRLAQSPLADLWPVQPSSSGAASAGETQELVRRYLGGKNLSGADRLGGAPAVVSRGALRGDARLLAGSAAAPLMAVRNWGDGRVIWTAFDPTKPPFLGWRGQQNLWIELVRLAQRPTRLESVDPQQRMGAPGPNGYYGNGNRGGYGGGYGNGYDPDGGNASTDATSGLLQNIKKLKQLQMPATSVIAWFLALYVFILVPVNYFILRLIDKRELAWITVPAIAVAFSFASYAAARSIKGTDLLARHINIVQGSTGDLARADAMLWLRSPRKGYYNLSSPNAQTALTDYTKYDPRSTSGSGETTLRQGEASRSFRVENYPVAMWEEAQFVGQSVLDVGQGVKVRLNSGVLSVQNATPFDMRGAVLINGGKIYKCGDGDLKAGTTATANLANDLGEGGPQLIGPIESVSDIAKIFAPSPGTAKTDTTLRDLAHTALTTALGTDWGKAGTGTVFIAWSDAPISPLQMEGETARAENVSLFVFRLPKLAIAGKTRLGAIVRKVASESPDPEPADDTERSTEYEVVLADEAPPKTLQITVKGTLNPYGEAPAPAPRPAPLPAPSGQVKTAAKTPDARLKIWNFATGAWQNTATLPRLEDAAGKQWTLKTQLSGATLTNALRRPDNVLRLRVRTKRAVVVVGGVEVKAGS